MRALRVFITLFLLLICIKIYCNPTRIDTCLAYHNINQYIDINQPDSALFLYLSTIDTLFKHGDRITAESYVNSAIQYTENIDSVIMPYTARLYGLKGYFYYYQNKFEEAINEYKKSLKLFTKDKKYPLKEIACQKGLAYCYLQLNKQNEALIYLNALLRWEQKYDYLVHPSEIYRIIGEINLENYDLYSARLYLNVAFGALSDVNDSIGMAEICNDLGILYQKMKDYSKALKNYKSALNLISYDTVSNLKLLSRIYNNIGSVHEVGENYTKAIDYYLRALHIEKNVQNTENICTISLNIALCLMYMDNLQGSLEYIKLATNTVDQYENHTFLTSDILYHEATIYQHFGDLTQALLCVKKCKDLLIDKNLTGEIDMFNHVASIPDLLNVILLEAEINHTYYSDTKNIDYLEKSVQDYSFAFRVMDYMRYSMHSEYSKLLLNESFLKKLRTALDVAYTYCNEIKDGNYNLLYTYAEKIKSTILAERLYENKQTDIVVPAELQSQKSVLEKQLNDFMTFLSQQPENSQQDITDIKLSMIKLENELKQIQKRIDSLSFSGSYSPQSIFHSVTEIQEQLDTSSSILNFIFSGNSLICLTITHTNIYCDYIKNTETLNATVTDYYRSIKKFEYQETDSLGKYLYNLLLESPLARLQGVDRILIIPDNYLYHLPFETLLLQDNNSVPHYLIEDYTVSYHYSASLWFSSAKSNFTDHSKTFAGIAPVFENDPINLAENNASRSLVINDSTRGSTVDVSKLPALPYSEMEIKEIASFLNSVSVNSALYLKKDASEDMFKHHLNNYDIIHIATHGIVDDEIPYLSGLILFPPVDSVNNLQERNIFQFDNCEDGILYANEIYELDLHSKLVVLSACESGLGKSINGEGLISLNRGFLSSGVSNVISSLWKVSDIQTKLFMVDFYKNLFCNNNDYASALRQTKIQFLRNEKYNFPYFWAGFFIVGE